MLWLPSCRRKPVAAAAAKLGAEQPSVSGRTATTTAGGGDATDYAAVYREAARRQKQADQSNLVRRVTW